jgi:hypothetical protein
MAPTNGRIQIFVAGGYFHSFRIMVNTMTRKLLKYRTPQHKRIFKSTMTNLNTPAHGRLEDTLPMVPTNGRIQIFIAGSHVFLVHAHVFWFTPTFFWFAVESKNETKTFPTMGFSRPTAVLIVFKLFWGELIPCCI